MAREGEKTGSQPIHKIKTEYDVYVKARDGVRLCVDIYRPEAEGKFPALFGTSSYGKTTQTVQVDNPLWRGGEGGDPNYIVPRGYAHVIGDARGSGKSEGEMRCVHSRQEQEDGYDVIEWIAQQPWCDGNVGMVGPSYFSVMQMLIAGLQPPHLKAIFAYDSPGDWYREGPYDGGIMGSFFQSGFVRGRRNYVSEVVEKTTPEELARLIKEKSNDPDIKIRRDLLHIVQNPWVNPFFFDILMQPTDGPFYRERSPCTNYDKIKIPVYCGSGWYAYTYTHLNGAFRHYAGVNAPKKLLISGPVWRGPDHPLALSWRQYHELMIRWYDHWLKGIDTGIMEEPPIKIFVMGVNKYRYENEWPLARTNWTKFYLRPEGGVLSTYPETVSDESNCFVQMPPSMTNTIKSLKYTTAPLAEPVEITGPSALYIYASIDQEDTNWTAVLRDVYPDGSTVELTRGWLKASHRALDPAKSTPWVPYHTHVNPEPVKPGEIYEYAIEIRPTSNVFKAGHCIQLEICNLEFPAPVVTPKRAEHNIHLPCGKTVVHKIYCNRKYQSHLLLPIIPKSDPSQWVTKSL